jgi:hypothetical protein
VIIGSTRLGVLLYNVDLGLGGNILFTVFDARCPTLNCVFKVLNFLGYLIFTSCFFDWPVCVCVCGLACTAKHEAGMR